MPHYLNALTMPQPQPQPQIIQLQPQLQPQPQRQFKKRGRPAIHKGKDYKEEIDNHTRCPKCKRITKGIEEYKNKKGTVFSTCHTCRAYVLEHVKMTLPPSDTQKRKAFRKMLQLIGKPTIKEAIKDNPELTEFTDFIYD